MKSLVTYLFACAIWTAVAQAADAEVTTDEVSGADTTVFETPESIAELRERVQRNEEMLLNRNPKLQWSGYVDVGFFAPQGDGSGYVQDFSNRYGNFGWVFLGDILAPAVNSRGEVADLGNAPGTDRFDSINSRGAPGFIVNELNLRMRAAMTPTAIITASLNITPRTGNDFRLGDVMDLDIAQVEWLPTQSQRTSLFVGKTDSVLGIEYRNRKSHQRFGVTPSLIARYTTNPAVGVKARTKFGASDWLVVAMALTNGSNTWEQFHFYDEVDSNAAKTGSARVSARLPFGVELGLSGSYGAPDRSPSSKGTAYFAGADVQADLGRLLVRAEFLKGKMDGRAADDVYDLDLKGGGYLELDWLINATFGAYGRGEYRSARVWLGDERLYATKSWRATAGVRMTLSEGSALKAEYLRNGEYGGLPAVRNDVFTSSLVLSF
ncbi:MAG: hypothetical protein SF187_30060 [Deltaproteobacteria bacterium]|nr:hypothetical protein [Deltaproteobacteria bacterium]